jgi:hypothetical protein
VQYCTQAEKQMDLAVIQSCRAVLADLPPGMSTGLKAYRVVGETLAPAVRHGDILVCCANPVQKTWRGLAVVEMEDGNTLVFFINAAAQKRRRSPPPVVFSSSFCSQIYCERVTS